MTPIKYLVTGAEGGQSRIPPRFADASSGLCYLPVISLKIACSPGEFLDAVSSPYEFSIFTSGKTAEIIFYNREFSDALKTAVFGKIIAVGEKTAELIQGAGFNVYGIPDEKSGEGIVDFLEGMGIHGKRVFLPHGNLAGNNLETGLRNLGAIVKTLLLYKNEIPDSPEINSLLKEISGSKPDWIIFQSPSGIRNFLSHMGIDKDMAYFKGIKIAVIGTTTGNFAREQGLKVDFLPENPSLENILDGIVEF